MVLNMRGRKAVMICALAGSTLLTQSAPASAISFFDRVFNTPANREYQRRRDLTHERKEIPPIRVSSARFYTYKPDLLKTISLAELAVPAVREAPEMTSDAATATHDDATGALQTAIGPQATGSQTTEPLITGAITDEVTTRPARAVLPLEAVAFDEARDQLSTMKLRALKEVGAAVKTHYAARPAYLWISDDAPNARANAVMATLASAEAVGLDPRDYTVMLPADILVASADDSIDLTAEDARKKALMRFEMELSAKVLTYALDAHRGRINPNKLSGYHDLPRKKVDLVAALDALASAENVGAELEAHNPGNMQFLAMKREVAALRVADETQQVTIADGTLLKPGRKNPEVANVVAAIRLQGSDELKQTHAETLAGYADTEEYTPELVALVKDFQRENKLATDGVVGRNTIRVLVGVSNEAKINKLTLAMERARWLPRDLGARRVFINQPAFRATYTGPGREPLSMKVVVGKKSNQTNFFYDKIERVEYNPYWGVPYSIIVNEMLPKLNEDPSYLDRIGYEVSTVSGKRVSSASVDWYSVAMKQSSINVRQPPGRKNALGELKIMFPNKHAIYMHDTPAKNLFKRDSRAYSHGCVRLEDPRAMAAAVLGKTKDYIGSRIAQGKNEADKVAADIPVYVAYFTAWPDATGTFGYYPDIYDRDKYLNRAIKATSKPRQG